jgi:hypothetical protein
VTVILVFVHCSEMPISSRLLYIINTSIFPLSPTSQNNPTQNYVCVCCNFRHWRQHQSDQMSTPFAFCRQKAPEIWRETIKQQTTFPIVLMRPNTTLCVLYVSLCKEELRVTLFIKFLRHVTSIDSIDIFKKYRYCLLNCKYRKYRYFSTGIAHP